MIFSSIKGDLHICNVQFTMGFSFNYFSFDGCIKWIQGIDQIQKKKSDAFTMKIKMTEFQNTTIYCSSAIKCFRFHHVDDKNNVENTFEDIYFYL